jgi:hypothetical protein
MIRRGRYHTHRRPFGERISCRDDAPCVICQRRALLAHAVLVVVTSALLVVLAWFS